MDKLIVATNANDILTRFWKTGVYEKFDSSSSSSDLLPNNPTAPVNGSTDGGQEEVAETLSPAMDILVSSNFERLLFYLALEGCTASVVSLDGEVDGGAASKVRKAGELVQEWMNQLKTVGRVVVPEDAVTVARREMLAGRASDEQVRTISSFVGNSSLMVSEVALDDGDDSEVLPEGRIIIRLLRR